MCNIICVTNRKLCRGNFIKRIEAIAKTKPYAIILREKDLKEEDYKSLASEVMTICEKYGVLCIMHSFVKSAINLKCTAIHMPLSRLRTMSELEKSRFTHIGASCHSLEEVKEAKELGCTYIVVGHIFNTDCKKDIPPRGLDFLRDVCNKSSIPVYAIGGINEKNISSVLNSGAKGCCIMSSVMECENITDYMEEFKNEL